MRLPPYLVALLCLKVFYFGLGQLQYQSWARRNELQNNEAHEVKEEELPSPTYMVYKILYTSRGRLVNIYNWNGSYAVLHFQQLQNYKVNTLHTTVNHIYTVQSFIYFYLAILIINILEQL